GTVVVVVTTGEGRPGWARNEASVLCLCFKLRWRMSLACVLQGLRHRDAEADPIDRGRQIPSMPPNGLGADGSGEPPRWRCRFGAVTGPSSERFNDGRAAAPAPGKDPRRLAELLEESQRLGPSSAERIAASLNTRREVRIAFLGRSEKDRPADVEGRLR